MLSLHKVQRSICVDIYVALKLLFTSIERCHRFCRQFLVALVHISSVTPMMTDVDLCSYWSVIMASLACLYVTVMQAHGMLIHCSFVSIYIYI